MRRSYLLPILAILPLMIVIYLVAQSDSANSPVVIGAIIATYLAANIIYSVAKKTFHVSILVELTLVSLIAYFVLINLT